MEPMPPDRFWAIVDKTTPYEADTERQVKELRQILEKLTADEIAAFDLAYNREMKRAYSWDLWGAVYVVHGGASDDGFHYFCAWLISKGQQVFESVLKNPDGLADWFVQDVEGWLEFEEFSYIAGEVWGEKTGLDMADRPFDMAFSISGDPTGEEFEDDAAHLSKRYPKLWNRFGETPLR